MCDTYDITYSDLNPTLYFAGKRTVTESNFSHTHDAPELFIVLSGDLAIWMDGTTTPLTAGDIVCVPSHMPHRTLPTMHDNPAILFFTSFSNFHFKGMEPPSFYIFYIISIFSFLQIEKTIPFFRA